MNNGAVILPVRVRKVRKVRKVYSLDLRVCPGTSSGISMRRIDARRKNASALRFRFSQSFASRRQRLSHAIVRSTIQRRGSTTNPLA